MATNNDIKKAIKALRQMRHKFNVLNVDLDDGVTTLGSIGVTSNNISRAVAEELADTIETRYNAFIADIQGWDRQDHSHEVHCYKSSSGWYVSLSGNQVLYDEFGTGDRGELYSHPDKAKYHLFGYNTGAYIKTSKNGAHYWNYYSTVSGKYTSSQGVPAGMMVYNGTNEVAENKATILAYRELEKELNKLFKSR